MRQSILMAATWLISATAALGAGMAADGDFIVLAEDQALAEAVLEQSGEYRREIALDLLGEELPPGVGRTVIYVRISDADDTGRTWAIDSPQRRLHSLWVNSTRTGVLGPLLKHEIAHVVMATRHPGALPSWAEEGVASRYDDPRRVEIRRRVLRWFAETGNWPRLELVLTAESLTSHDQASYAVAASLTEYLLARADHETFFAFAVDGRRKDWDAAARARYGAADAEALERAWRTWASSTEIAASSSGR
jgi:hypothetical protein